MERRDIRNNIIPAILENNDDRHQLGNKTFNTEDLIYIEHFDKNSDRLIMKKYPCTDYALMNNAYVVDFDKSKLCYAFKWLRTPYFNYNVYYSGGYGQAISITSIGICPALYYKIPPENEYLASNFNIRDSMNVKNNDRYHVLDLGEYPRSKVSENLGSKLEKLYNNGELNSDLICTGRWYSNNALKDGTRGYAGKHNPEFEYMGERFVRVAIIINDGISCTYSDKTKVTSEESIKWVKVEPITFVIRNWDELPKYINPYGSGKASFFDLVSENVIISNIPFYPNGYDDNANMWQNSTIRGFLNGIDVREITENGNANFQAVDGGDFTSECNFLNEAFNLSRDPMAEYSIPESERIIPNNAFNGCVSLKKLIIPSTIKNIGKNVFDGLKFKYLYLNNGNMVFSNDFPIDINKDIRIIELEKIINAFDNFDYNILLKNFSGDYNILDFALNVSKSKFKISYKYVEKLIKKEIGDDLFNNSVFKFFGNENSNINNILEELSDEEKVDFWKFAQNLGCFSKQKILDKDGKETEVIMAQKASTFIATVLRNKIISPNEFHAIFNIMDYDVIPNQDFLNFVTVQDNKKTFSNLELLLDMEKEFPGIFSKAMTEFDKVKSHKTTLDENGKPVTLSWNQALRNFYVTTMYKGVKPENEDIAIAFADKGISQITFNTAVGLRKTFINDNVPEHLLGKPLKEDSVLESIERIRIETEYELLDSKKMIDELYSKQFTYEWLNKNDPKNFIIGVYTSCCASITGSLYGREITKASVTSPDVQTIVVKDSHGDIISKGTMYINRKAGYAVINDFELNSRYRKHDPYNANYSEEQYDREAHVKELILKAFKRGIDAFVKEYNEQNLYNPINQVNVGIGFNKLREQIKEFYQKGEILEVPKDYSFNDAAKEQYVLYLKDEEKDEESNLNRE